MTIQRVALALVPLFCGVSALAALESSQSTISNPARVAIPSVERVSSPLTRRADQQAVARHLQESVSALEINDSLWNALSSHDDVLITDLPLGPLASRSLVLHRVNPFELQPTIVGATIGRDGVVTETPIPVPELACYIGSVLDDSDSRVLLARGEGFVVGYVQTQEKTWIISNERAGSSGPIVSYAMDEVPPGTFPIPEWTCQTLMSPDWAGGEGSHGGIADVQEPCWQSRIAIDTDVEFLGLFGNNQAAAIGYVGTLFAALSDIYPRDVHLRPGMSYLRLWTDGADPWGASGTVNQLYEFQAYWEQQVFTGVRDSAALLSGRGLGGGVAWLNSGCGSYAYSVSANLAGSFPYPLVDNNGGNWDIMVFAHELGHNYGAPHTHSYTPPADGCGSSPQDCSAASNDLGTIMSYCHQCSGGMSNINLYFHQANVGSIEAYLPASGCGFTAAAQPAVAIPDRMSALPGTTIDIDVLKNDIRFNCENLTIVANSPPAQGCTAVIVPGAGPSGRAIVRFTSPALGPTSITFSYTVAELSGSQALALVTVDLVSLRLPEYPTGDTPGVTTRYYELNNPSVLPNFDMLIPYDTTSVPQMNFGSTNGNFATSNRSEQVGAVFTGWLNVPTGGTWTLFTHSDDGSRLLIGSDPLVANDGLHPMVERSGSIDLAQGKHAVRVEFFENGGGAGLIVSWSGPNTPKSVIPASALTAGGTINQSDINHDGVVDGIDLTILLSGWGASQAGADINNDGTVDGTDLATLLAGWSAPPN